MPPPPKETAEKPLRVRIGKVGSVEIYEIKDSELDVLEKGSPAELQLVFAVFLLTLAFSGICTLDTATFTNPTVKTTVIVVTVLGTVLGFYFLFSWWRNKTSLKNIAQKIRQRMPPEAADAAAVETANPQQSETIQPKG